MEPKLPRIVKDILKKNKLGDLAFGGLETVLWNYSNQNRMALNKGNIVKKKLVQIKMT